jgi:hypothetical protein
MKVSVYAGEPLLASIVKPNQQNLQGRSTCFAAAACGKRQVRFTSALNRPNTALDIPRDSGGVGSITLGNNNFPASEESGVERQSARSQQSQSGGNHGKQTRRHRGHKRASA